MAQRNRPAVLDMPPPAFPQSATQWQAPSPYQASPYEQPYFRSPDSTSYNNQGHQPAYPFVHPHHYALSNGYEQSSVNGSGTPQLTPAREASSIASTPASSNQSWANLSGYFANASNLPSQVQEMQTNQQIRPRRAQSVSSLRHSPYPHASPHTSPVQQHAPTFSSMQQKWAPTNGNGSSAVVTQAAERLSSAAHRLETMVHAVSPTVSKTERDEVEAMLDAAIADLKACFFGQSQDGQSTLVHRRNHASSISMSNMLAAKQREAAAPQQTVVTSRRPSIAEPPPLLHSHSTPVVPTYGNTVSNSSMAVAGLHQASIPSSQPPLQQPTLATLMQETANDPSLLVEPLRMPDMPFIESDVLVQPQSIRSVPPTPGPFAVHNASPLANVGLGVPVPSADDMSTTPLATPQPSWAAPIENIFPPIPPAPLQHKRSASALGGHTRNRSSNGSSIVPRQVVEAGPSRSVPVEGDGSIVKGSDVPNLTDARKAALDAAFLPWLATVCKDADMTDSKGEQIHQTLTAKRMSTLESDDKFRLFKFRIQAFTNRFVADLALQEPEDQQLPYKVIRMYLWQNPLVCRYNADGRKSKSKGNHVWAAEGRKLPNGELEFRPFTRRIILPAENKMLAIPGQPFQWDAHIFDPHTPIVKAAFSSPPGSLPDWLEWRRTKSSGTSKKAAADDDGLPASQLSGDVPLGLDCSLEIPVHASFTLDGERLALDTVLTLEIGRPSSSSNEVDMADSDEDDGGGAYYDELEFDQDTRPPSPTFNLLADDLLLPPPPPLSAGPSSASAAAVAPIAAFGVPPALVDGIAQVMDVAKARLEPESEAAVAAQASNNAPAAAAVDMLTNPVQLYMKEQSISAATRQVGPIQAALMHQAEVQREYDSVANMAVLPLVPAAQQKEEQLQHLGRACDQARVHVADVISIEQSKAIEAVATDPLAAAVALTAVDEQAAAVLAPLTSTATPTSDHSPPGGIVTPAVPTSAGPPSSSTGAISSNISGLFVAPPHLQQQHQLQ